MTPTTDVTQKPVNTEADFRQKLLERGLIKRVANPQKRPSVRHRIRVEGKPVSELLIEERR